jgi:prophage maintenance system killer protein
MMKEKKKFQPLTCEQISQIYTLLHKEGFVAFPYTQASKNKLEAIVSNVNGSNYGIENYTSSREKAVAYLYFLIKNHPFTDGNKRTASLAFAVLCDLNDLNLNLGNITLDELVVALEQNKIRNHHLIITALAEALFKK